MAPKTKSDTAEPGADQPKTTRPVEVLIASAPGGPRRRAGLSFDKEPVNLFEEDLGATTEERRATLDALRADPKLKIDGAVIDIEVVDEQA